MSPDDHSSPLPPVAPPAPPLPPLPLAPPAPLVEVVLVALLLVLALLLPPLLQKGALPHSLGQPLSHTQAFIFW